mgnify:CR=1 FL=1
MYVNLEMSTRQITNRILASMSGVPLWKIKHKKIGLFLPKLADQEIYPYICALK